MPEPIQKILKTNDFRIKATPEQVREALVKGGAPRREPKATA